MPNLIAPTVEGTIARLSGQMGVRWPNPWWPTGVSTYDDCAACISWMLFGLNGNQPFYTYVSQIQNWGRTVGGFHSGAGGIQRGDILGFDWDGDGGYDHTEVALTPINAAGIFTTLGTNAGTTDNVAVRTRYGSNVLSFTRPPYQGSGGGSTPSASGRNRKNMWTLDWDTGGTGYLTTDNGVLPISSPQVYNLFYRKINSNQLLTPFSVPQVPAAASGRPDVFLKAEQDIVAANLRILNASIQASVAIDPGKLESALQTALGSVDLKTTEDPTALANAFTAVAPSIVSAILKQAGTAIAGAGTPAK